MFSQVKNLAAALAVAGAALGLGFGTAQAEYPEKPVTMVIPLGAGGQKGTQEVANAEADGYTLLFTHNYIDMLQQHVENLPYDPNKDFVSVARINYAPVAVVVRADSPYKTFQELIDAAKANPGSVRMTHSGNWGAFFVPAAQIMKKLDAEFNLVPYQGGGPAMQALLSGDADVTMGFPSTLSAQLDAGKIRLLATAGKERMFDDVPAFAEVGIGGDVGFMHRVVLSPAGTPDEAIAKLTEAFVKLAEDKTFNQMMGRLSENIDILDGPTYQKIREEQNTEYQDLVKSITSQ